MQQLVILGSTGSIGAQALQVVERHPERFKILALTTNVQIDLLREQIERFRPRFVAVGDTNKAAQLRRMIDRASVTVLDGLEGCIAVARLPEAELVISAMSGAAGFLPTVAAIQKGKTIALANKETLVMGGAWVTKEAERCGASLIPVDSEHSAIFQMLQGINPRHIRKITLTASGGPFGLKPEVDFNSVTVQQALAHPTWCMGKRISIDSATLMNKGFELIEAHWLFQLPMEQLEVVIHPESVVHAFVECNDGAVIAHLAVPDMRLPIQYALSYPERWSHEGMIRSLELQQLQKLSFYPVDEERFRCLMLAKQAIAHGGTAPAVLNAADERAVWAFLEERIRFSAIPVVIEAALNHVPINSEISPEIIWEAHVRTGEWVEDFLKRGIE